MDKFLLILDDDPDFVTPLAKRLEWEGFRTMVFYRLHDFRKRRSILEKTMLILCDFSMPGNENEPCWRILAKTCRAMKAAPPLFIISGLGQTPPLDHADLRKFNLGGYLQKPIDFENLKNLIAQVKAEKR